MEQKHIVKIDGLTREQALCALFNAAKPQGLGKLHYRPEHRLDEVHAGLILCMSDYVDYLEGRVIKTEFKLGAKEIDCTLYDRDNGEGAGEREIDEYRRKLEGLCPNTFVPFQFMGAKREEDYAIGGIKCFKFDVLGGELKIYEMPDKIFSCPPKQYFEFSLTEPNTRKSFISKYMYEYGGRLINEEMFRHYALMAIQGVLNQLAEI